MGQTWHLSIVIEHDLGVKKISALNEGNEGMQEKKQ